MRIAMTKGIQALLERSDLGAPLALAQHAISHGSRRYRGRCRIAARRVDAGRDHTAIDVADVSLELRVFGFDVCMHGTGASRVAHATHRLAVLDA